MDKTNTDTNKRGFRYFEVKNFDQALWHELNLYKYSVGANTREVVEQAIREFLDRQANQS